MVRIYVWPGGYHWLATCSVLGVGAVGDTREAALDHLKTELGHEAEMVFGANSIEVVSGPPPEEMQ